VRTCKDSGARPRETKKQAALSGQVHLTAMEDSDIITKPFMLIELLGGSIKSNGQPSSSVITVIIHCVLRKVTYSRVLIGRICKTLLERDEWGLRTY
jgi:hypothetical protein